jgi:hypothetical protein
MRLPKAEPGLVFRYDFLWQCEAAKGGKSGKVRPACLLVALEDPAGSSSVVVLPITHSEPKAGTEGIEIPAAVCKNLGLDEDRSWVIVSEYNVDDWPNGGISPVPGRHGAFTYGYLSPRLLESIKRKFVDVIRQGRAKTVRR